MIIHNQNQLLNQMQSLESLAKGQALPAAVQTDRTTSFVELMQKAVNQVNQTQMEAANLGKAFELGEKVDLAEVMIAIQKSRVSFQALTEVRNKLLTAYQDVMNMPV